MEGCYHVYIVEPTGGYSGCSLVAAESAECARSVLEEFENRMNSRGYSSLIREDDRIEDVYSCRKGVLKYGIFYYGGV